MVNYCATAVLSLNLLCKSSSGQTYSMLVSIELQICSNLLEKKNKTSNTHVLSYFVIQCLHCYPVHHINKMLSYYNANAMSINGLALY